MVKYEINLTEESNEVLKTVSDASGTPIKEILEEFINNNVGSAVVDLAVQEYKKGNLKAMKAWKLTGLTFDEFNAIAKE